MKCPRNWTRLEKAKGKDSGERIDCMKRMTMDSCIRWGTVKRGSSLACRGCVPMQGLKGG
jgi:hypothetical protein